MQVKFIKYGKNKIRKRVIFYDGIDYLFSTGIGKINPKNVSFTTVEDYVDCLKKRAFRRFGKIQDGDIIDFSDLTTGEWIDEIKELESNDWEYDEENDELMYDGWLLYRDSSWAKLLRKQI